MRSGVGREQGFGGVAGTVSGGEGGAQGAWAGSSTETRRGSKWWVGGRGRRVYHVHLE